MTSAQRLTLTVPEVADLLGVHPLTVRAAIKRGEIPAVSVGRRVLVPRLRLEQFLSGNGSADRGDPHEDGQR